MNFIGPAYVTTLTSSSARRLLIFSPAPPVTTLSSRGNYEGISAGGLHSLSLSRGFANSKLITLTLIFFSLRIAAAAAAFSAIAPRGPYFGIPASCQLMGAPFLYLVYFLHINGSAPWITYGARGLHFRSVLKHILQLSSVLWSHNGHVGHMAQVAYIEYSVMSFSVSAYYSGPVNTEDHQEASEDIHPPLSDRRPAEERWNIWLQKACSLPLPVPRQRLRRVPRRFPRPKSPFGKFSAKGCQPRSLGHGGAYGYDFFIPFGHLRKLFAEYLRI